MAVVRAIGRVLIVIGATLLFFVLYELVGTSQITRHHQSVLAHDFDDALRRPVAPRTTPPAPLPGRAFARIRIPAIGVNAIVVEGTSLRHLAKGPGHYPETPSPWQPGSVGIAGHRTGWGQPFYDLDKLRGGHEVVLETLRGTYRYRVTHRAVVEPSQIEVLKGDPQSDARFKLTLTTCTPKYTSLNRLIVWADLVAGPAP